METKLKNKIADFAIDYRHDHVEIFFENDLETLISYSDFFAWVEMVDRNEERLPYTGKVGNALVELTDEDYPILRSYQNQLEDLELYLKTRVSDPFKGVEEALNAIL